MGRQTWLVIAAALALAACDEEMTGTDAGADGGTTPAVDAGGGGMDAGTDAGTDEEDAGTDAGAEGDASTDGGTMDTDGGPLMVGDCVGAPITVQADCPAFTACGGIIDNPEYCYTGVCIEEAEILGPLSAVCAGSTLEDPSGSIAGQVSFPSTTQVHRQTVSHAEVTLVIPATCGALLLLGCDGFEGQIETNVPDSTAECSMATGEPCRCEVTIDSTLDMTESFTADTDTGVLTVGTGATERTYDYCVDDTDGSLQFVETTEDAAEPGIQSLAPAGA